MLSGRLAIVTGAASGIGLEIAKTFSKNESSVIMVDIKDQVNKILDELNYNKNLKHSAFICDVSNAEQVEKLFQSIQDMYGAEKVPDIIVNCAGIQIYGKMIDLDYEKFDKMINTNLRGTFLVSQAAAKLLVANYESKKHLLTPLNTYASIINISSVNSKGFYVGASSAYAASKGGIESFTRVMAGELANYQIRCNSILPGPINSPLNTPDKNPNFEEHKNLTYLKRIGESSEVAQVCVFLASDMSSYITGASIDVTGGIA